MAIKPENVSDAIWKKREFFWEYVETKGYVLRGRLPWRKNSKIIGTTRNWKKAQEACKWIGDEHWQQLATLISQIEKPKSLKKTTPKADKNTLDLFTTENEGGQ